MNINIRLNNKSIQSAIERLKKAQAKIPEMKIEFFKRCCVWLIQRANTYLNLFDIGSAVISDIQRSWSYVVTGNGAQITNTSDKAVFVEFGVGIVGEENSHENAENAGYEYNVESTAKYAGKYHDENTWRFYADSQSEIDLIVGNYEEWYTKSGKIKVITRGSPSVMYAFNALVDLRLEMPAIWQQVKEKYWR